MIGALQIDLYAIQDSKGNTDFATVEKELSRLDDSAAKLIQRIKNRELLGEKRPVFRAFGFNLWQSRFHSPLSF